MANRFFKRNCGYYSLEILLALGFMMYFGVVDQYTDCEAGFFLVAFGFLAFKGVLFSVFDWGWYNAGEEDEVDTRNGVLPYPVYMAAPMVQVYNILEYSSG